MTAAIQIPVEDLYKQALAIEAEDLGLTKEQIATLDTAQKAWRSAREQLDVASRSRKDRVERVTVAESLVKSAGVALEAAKQPEEDAERDRNIRVARVMEEMYARMAAEALDAPIRYLNTVPTGEKVHTLYGERDEYRSTVDLDPIPLYVRGYEAGDIRIVPRSGRNTDMTFEVQRLGDETYEDTNVRKDLFGNRVTVSFDHPRRRYGSEKGVTVQWSNLSGSPIDEAESFIELAQTGIRLARIVERVVAESK